MWEEIAKVFTSMQWYIIVPLIIGVVLLIAECFIPDFGACGITGIVCLVGGILGHAIITKSIVQTLFLILLFAIVIIVLILIFIRSAKYGLISKTPLVEKRTAVPIDYADKDKDVNKGLVGKEGTTKTPFTPSGKFVVDGETYDGMTNGEPLEKDVKIVVVDVEGNKIVIKKMEEGK